MIKNKTWLVQKERALSDTNKKKKEDNQITSCSFLMLVSLNYKDLNDVEDISSKTLNHLFFNIT